MKVSLWAIKHPVPVAIICTAMILLGILAFFSLNREFIPPITQPTVAVVTLWPGVAAEDVEQEVTLILEEQFSNLPGLKNMRSESREGVSIINLQLGDNEDVQALVQEIRARVNRSLPDLPQGIYGQPDVSAHGSADLPVFTFAISGLMNSDQLTRFVENELLPELYRVDGVALAKIVGGQEKIIEVRLDLQAVVGAGSTPVEILYALERRNTSVPGGVVEWGENEWSFRINSQYQTIEDIGNLAIGSTEGSPIFLMDVASIVETYDAPTERIRSLGTDMVVVQITKRESGNVLKMAQEIKSRLKPFEDQSFEFIILHNDAEIIQSALSSVSQSALVGLFMAIAVIWIFLKSWRYTVVIAVSLPLSLVLAFVGMRLAGLSINVLTMAGLTVSLGMIVDAGIVVLENIHRLRDAGDTPLLAAKNGSSEVTGAVFASIATSICVFAPMLFLDGIVGIVMRDLSLTLIFALGASLFSAIVVIPLLSSHNVRGRRSQPKKIGRMMQALETQYQRGLRGALNRVYIVIVSAVGILVVSILAVGIMGISFLPAADYNEIFVSFRLPPGSTLNDGVAVADQAENLIFDSIPEVSSSIFYVGMEDDFAGDSRTREAIWAQIQLHPERDRSRTFQDIISELNIILPPSLPGVSVNVVNGGFDHLIAQASDGAGYRVALSATSWPELESAAKKVERMLLEDPEIISTDRNVRSERQTIIARLNPLAMGQLGIDTQEAAYSTSIAFDGMDAGEFRPPGGIERSIRLTSELKKIQPDSRATNLLSIRSIGGRYIPLDAFTEIQEDLGLSSIRRHDRKRTLTVIGFTESENLREIDSRFKSSIIADPLEDSVEWKIEGIGQLIGDSTGRLGLVLLVSLFLVYSVIAIQFERVVQPLIILASVPFCFIGVVLGLAIFGSSLSLVSFLGIVALGGIVVNNAIVQVDRINQLRSQGLDLMEAIVQGAVTRLRPILMTTLTTFCGVIPLSLARGSGARIYAPLGQAIAGGLMSSTLVTLFLIPVLYWLTERKKELRGTIES